MVVVWYYFGMDNEDFGEGENEVEEDKKSTFEEFKQSSREAQEQEEWRNKNTVGKSAVASLVCGGILVLIAIWFLGDGLFADGTSILIAITAIFWLPILLITIVSGVIGVMSGRKGNNRKRFKMSLVGLVCSIVFIMVILFGRSIHYYLLN
jgi:hypothetical protein